LVCSIREDAAEVEQRFPRWTKQAFGPNQSKLFLWLPIPAIDDDGPDFLIECWQ